MFFQALRFVVICILIIVSFTSDYSCYAQTKTAQCPVLITSCGQSPGALKVKVFMLSEKKKFLFDMLADVNVFKNEKFKTAMIITGASNEGMDAAGVSANDELSRIADFIKQAKKENVMIIAAHLEGKAKRSYTGKTEEDFNERIIDLVYPKSDMIIIRVDGNEDQRFSKIASAHNIPLVQFEKNLMLSGVLKEIFND